MQHAFTVQYTGDGLDYDGSSSAAGPGSTVTVLPNDFTFTLSGGQNFTVVPGQSISYGFQITPTFTLYPGTVTFTVTGLPPGASAIFTPMSIAANGGPQIVTLTVNTVLAANHTPTFSGRDLSPSPSVCCCCR